MPIGVGRGRVGLGRSDLHGRDQRQTDVANLLEETVQGRLVRHMAVDESGAAALVGEAESVEPRSPMSIEMPLEADLVLSGLVTTARRCVRLVHGLTVGADVVSGDHHKW